MNYEVLSQAMALVATPQAIAAILLSAAYGLLVGCIPGLSATMATALLVPVTFFLPPIPAVAAIVTASAMAIFAGDIPGALLRIPGTPASAAYVNESYALTMKGFPELALGTGLWFSVLGGLVGTAVMVLMSQPLAEIALGFGSFEFFWLVVLGLSAAAFVGSEDVTKALVMLMLGLAISCIGIDNPSGVQRYSFGNPELLSSFGLIPIMVGLFAVAEVLRAVVDLLPPARPPEQPIGNVMKGMWRLTRQYKWSFWRGSLLGTVVGIQPGSGPDMAAWMSYAVSKKMSREPEKFGTGHVEGIIESGAANNSALAGAWIPAVVFGIPGDTITAIAIGVLYMKGLNPGPTLFTENPQNIYAIFLVFAIANLLMLPFGWMVIKAAKNIIKVPRRLLLPAILAFCATGAFATNNSLFDVGVVLAFGVLGYVLDDNGFPVAPMVLGVVLGTLLEETFITSLMKADGDPLVFFTRPIAGTLAALTAIVFLVPLLRCLARLRRPAASQ